MAQASDYIISDADKNAVNVASQPTVLRGTAEQNKQAFDNYCDLIRTHFNDLCAYVDTDTSAEIAVSVKTQYAALGWVQD